MSRKLFLLSLLIEAPICTLPSLTWRLIDQALPLLTQEGSLFSIMVVWGGNTQSAIWKRWQRLWSRRSWARSWRKLERGCWKESHCWLWAPCSAVLFTAICYQPTQRCYQYINASEWPAFFILPRQLHHVPLHHFKGSTINDNSKYSTQLNPSVLKSLIKSHMHNVLWKQCSTYNFLNLRQTVWG